MLQLSSAVLRDSQLTPHIPADKQALWAISWLRDEPLRIWEAEMAVKAAANAPCSLQDFKDFLLKHYDTLLPARRFKQQFRELKQTGSVSEYTRSMKRLIYELKGTPMEVSPNDIIDRYIEGLKPAPRKYVQTNAPQNWWQDADELFTKALQYEINISAATNSYAPAQLNAHGVLLRQRHQAQESSDILGGPAEKLKRRNSHSCSLPAAHSQLLDPSCSFQIALCCCSLLLSLC